MSDALFERRRTCRVCSSPQLELVLDYGAMPLAGGFFAEDDARSRQVFPLTLVRCEKCTLMQVAETVNPAIIFQTYSYSSSVNRTLVSHNGRLARLLRSMAGPEGLIAEIGCNDGVLLNPLLKLGAKIVGIDPSDVAKAASGENGWPLLNEYINRTTAARVKDQFGAAAIIVANNVCAHMDDPNVLVEGVHELLAPEGRFIFEVHYQADLIETAQYDTVYHEHTCYYSLASLEKLLALHDLKVIDVQRIPIHGGSIRVTSARLSSSSQATSRYLRLRAHEESVDISGFSNFASRHRKLLHSVLVDLKAAGKHIVAYGASGRATILLNFCGLGPDLLDHVSDLSPLRYNRVVPGVRVPIRPREEFHHRYPDYALMTAWNYESEIVADEKEFLAQGKAFIVPLPAVRII